MKNTKTLTTAAIMVALAVTLGIILYILPFFQFALFIIGVPIVILGFKTDIKVQLLASLAVLLIMMMFDPTYALMIGFVVLPLSILQGYCLHKNKKTSETIFISGLGMVFGFIAFLYSLNMVFNIDILNEMTVMFDQSIVQVRSFYETMNTFSKAELNEIFATISEYKTYIIMMMPATIILASYLTAILSFMVSRKILLRMGESVDKRYFKDFRIQGQGRMVLMVVLGVVTLMSIVDKSNMEYYILNFMSVFTLILQINGLAFVWYLSEKHPNRKSMRTVIIIILLLSSFLGAIALIIRFMLGILGFADLYVDFRKKIESREQ